MTAKQRKREAAIERAKVAIGRGWDNQPCAICACKVSAPYQGRYLCFGHWPVPVLWALRRPATTGAELLRDREARSHCENAEKGRVGATLADAIEWERLGLGRVFFVDGRATWFRNLTALEARRA